MAEQKLTQDMSFDELADHYAVTGNQLIENLYSDCIRKSEADLEAIIKSFKKQSEKWDNRLMKARIENGSLISANVLGSQKAHPSSEFEPVEVQQFNRKTLETETVIKYRWKNAIGQYDVDQATTRQFKELREKFPKEQLELLNTVEKYRKTQAEFEAFKLNPTKFSAGQFTDLMSRITDTETKYKQALKSVGMSREQFEVKAIDVKSYVKELQRLKKAEVTAANARVQMFRAQIGIVTAILNKKRANKEIKAIRAKGTINTGMIDADVENIIELPKEESTVTPEATIQPEIPNHA